MKLDPKQIRYITQDELRVLQAIELGSKNHEVVPTSLIASLAKLRHSGLEQTLRTLTRYSLVACDYNAKYDGYRLAYGGYDYLALKTFAKRGAVASVGHQIGVGKESDVYVVEDDAGERRVLKIARLGRTSFRNIKHKRDYVQHRSTTTWWYLSRLAAAKEHAFMATLHEHGFPVPKPIDVNRHCIVMEAIDALPLNQIAEVGDPAALYDELMELIVRLGRHGLIHCDFNEFNLLVRDGEHGTEVTLIDFPQMVSTRHANAGFYFSRDVECVRRFFRRRFRFESESAPSFERDVLRAPAAVDLGGLVRASGWSRRQDDDLLAYFSAEGSGGVLAVDSGGVSGGDSEGSEGSEDSSESDESESAGESADKSGAPEAGVEQLSRCLAESSISKK